MQQLSGSAELTGLTLEAARAILNGATQGGAAQDEAMIEIVETVPPLGAKSPLRGATDEGVWRVLRASRTDTRWVLLVAREQTRA